MKKFTKVSLIIVAVMAGAGILFLGLSSLMGAGYKTVWQMADNGELDLGNWHIREYGVYYSDDETEDEMIPAGQSDALKEYSADAIKQIALTVETAEILFTKSGENDTIRVQLNNGDNGKFECFVEDEVLQVSYDVEKYTVISKKQPEIIISIPEGMTFQEMALDIGASELDFKASAVACDTLTVNVGAGEVGIEYIEVRERMELVIGAGEVDIEGGSFQDVALECGVGSVSLKGILLGNLDAHCGMGEIDMELTARESDFNYALSCGMGELKVNDTKYSSISGSRNIRNEGADKTITLDCGMGSVKLDICE